jgi:hypothetical protein
VRYKTKQARSAVLRQIRFLVNPRKNKRREKCLQLTAYSSGINVLRDYVMIDNQPQYPTKNCQKGRIVINFFLPLCLGNTARHLRRYCSIHPLEELNDTRRDRVKGGPREYTHIHMGIHEGI